MYAFKNHNLELFGDFFIFWYSFLLPQLKRNQINMSRDSMYELPNKLPNYLKTVLKIYENLTKIPKIQEPSRPPEMKILTVALENCKKSLLRHILFYPISRICPQHSVQDCINFILGGTDLVLRQWSFSFCLWHKNLFMFKRSMNLKICKAN